ncbi:MAG: aminotransferase class V-fold PLP-dependent enzyme [Alphaproteobacteria bacterium]|nr:MAG: aminotransferase class V-fold PLP-dependent enzyme [Alphaproteobacteria bacterium]
MAHPDFALDPSLAYLNHGSYGAVPQVVLAAVAAIRARQEANPVAFFEHEARAGLRAAAHALAPLVGTTAERLALVPNASTGTATVLASLSLRPGDRIVVTDHGYNAVRLQLEAVAARTGAVVTTVAIPVPVVDDAEVIAALRPALRGARLLIIDWITSPTAIILPVARLVALARAEGVPVLVDGAHAPGHVAMALDRLGADWVTGNAHKWLCAPRGTAFLYAAPGREPLPLVISHDQPLGFPQAFDWTGTIDCSGPMALPVALAWYRAQTNLMVRNSLLARVGAEVLTAAWGTAVTAPPSMRGAMAAVAAPAGLGIAATRADALALHQRLRREFRIEVPVMAFQDRLWVRISAQVYNSIEEYHRLAAAVVTIQRGV